MVQYSYWAEEVTVSHRRGFIETKGSSINNIYVIFKLPECCILNNNLKQQKINKWLYNKKESEILMKFTISSLGTFNIQSTYTHLLGQALLIGQVISANVFLFAAVRAQCAKEPRFASFWFCVTHIDGFYIIYTDI